MLVLAVMVLLASTVSFADEPNGPLRVVDGDTIYLGKQRHRLQGIDAPEINQECRKLDGTAWKCGKAATTKLKKKIGAHPVTCVSNGRDRYKRHLSVCHAGGVNLNAWMIRQGWAVAYPTSFKPKSISH
ncbi:MAG: thermonuclease family protein [Candidatus Latescibacteria bacterium]|jgi:endonuclease YncB( thermonuclease family)|nr:thermonuclease family protein [Candidatus Latescibacterota bacterium]